MWAIIVVSSALSFLAGYAVFSHFPERVVSVTLAIAADGILAMLVDTMILEAFSKTYDIAGIITVQGFVISFMLSKNMIKK